MSTTIQVKRGAGTPATLAAGEPAFDSTNHKFYVGDGTTNTFIGPVTGTAITPSSVASSGTVTGSNLGSIVASADLTGQTVAVASVATYTPGADGTYRIGVYVTITAVALDVLNIQVDYTDETNAARTQTFVPAGLTSANLSAVGASIFPEINIRVKNGVAITIKTVLITGTGSIQYDVGCQIERLR